ncbi:MAG: AMP-binding protein [Vicinamibacterales bacterium]
MRTAGDPLVARLERHAAERREATAFTLLNGNLDAVASVSFGGLADRARAAAAEVARLTAPGDRVLLAYPTGLDFLSALLGCLRAGRIAVPVPVPRPGRDDQAWSHVAADSGASLVLTDSATRPVLERLDQAPAVPIGQFEGDGIDGVDAPADAPPAMAFLQYTSGSTSRPRGVMVTPANLAYNLAYIRDAFDAPEGTVSVTWLPHYHDMGLVGGLLAPLWGGDHALLLSPALFVQRPRRWLEAVSRYRATHSGGPDFAYELAAARAGATSGLDLSCWRCAFTGAEPVRAATLDRFTAVLGAAGFDRRAFYPCYGMAETTLMITGGTVGAGPRLVGGEDGRSWVACGRARAETRVAIADEALSRRLPAGEVGEVVVSGPTVAAGYWGRAEESAAVFEARLADEPGRWLRTGDLGFLTADGDLVITGRSKDLLIVRGQNVYPQDVEQAAELASDGVAARGVAAFAAREGDDHDVVVVVELTREGLRGLDAHAAGGRIAEAVSRACDLSPARVVFLKPGGLPRTTSGKVQRRRCRMLLDHGALPVAGEWRHAGVAATGSQPAGTEVEDAVQAWLLSALTSAARVETGRFDAATPLAEMGLDSLQAIQLSGRLEERLGQSLSPTLIWEHSDVRSLAHAVVRAAPEAAARLAVGAAPEIAPVTQAGMLALDRRDTHNQRMVHLWKAPTNPDIESALQVDATALARRLAAWQAVPPYVSLEHIVVKAVAEALRRVPDANSRLRFGRIVPRETVSVTTIVTVPAPGGRTLMRNIQIEHADKLSVEQIAEDARRRTAAVVKAVASGAPDPLAVVPDRAWRGVFAAWRWLDINPGRSHFSSAVVSNIGALGAGSRATASAFIPNSRQFPIYWNMALPTIRLEPAVVDGAVVPRPTLTLYSTFDHRIFTGPIIAAVYEVLVEVLTASGPDLDDGRVTETQSHRG